MAGRAVAAIPPEGAFPGGFSVSFRAFLLRSGGICTLPPCARTEKGPTSSPLRHDEARAAIELNAPLSVQLRALRRGRTGTGETRRKLKTDPSSGAASENCAIRVFNQTTDRSATLCLPIMPSEHSTDGDRRAT